jgi:hypothetical protein
MSARSGGREAYCSPVGLLLTLRRLDSAVAQTPRLFVSHAVAGVGLLYVVLGGGYWLVSVLRFDYALDSDRAMALALFPWSGLPLLLVLLGRSARAVGVVVAAAALVQFILGQGNWGLELAYLPLLACGVLLVALGQQRPPAKDVA